MTTHTLQTQIMPPETRVHLLPVAAGKAMNPRTPTREMYEALSCTRAAQREAERMEAYVIHRLLERGQTWRQIADQYGMSRNGAYYKFGPMVQAIRNGAR